MVENRIPERGQTAPFWGSLARLGRDPALRSILMPFAFPPGCLLASFWGAMAPLLAPEYRPRRIPEQGKRCPGIEDIEVASQNPFCWEFPSV